MRHLRFVHNTQTVLSLSVIYLVASSWTIGPEVGNDLDAFLRTAQLVRGAINNPGNVAALVQEVRSDRAKRRRDVVRAIGHRTTVVLPAHADTATSLPNDDAPIIEQWRAIKEHHWTVRELAVSHQVFADVRSWYSDWYRQWEPCIAHFVQDLEEVWDGSGGPLSGEEIRAYTTPKLTLVVEEWDPGEPFVDVTLEMAVHIPNTPSTVWCQPDAFSNRTPNARVWQPEVQEQAFGIHEFPVEERSVSVPSSTFDRFPYLQGVLPAIGTLTPSEVRQWIENLTVSEIRGRVPRLMGTNVRNQDFGLVALTAITALHLYLLTTLSAVRRRTALASQEQDRVPWLASVRSVLPILFSVVTLVLCPVAATGLALWRLTSVPTFYVISWSGLLLGLGIAITAWALHLGPNGESERRRANRT